jgi:hypothetical protein
VLDDGPGGGEGDVAACTNLKNQAQQPGQFLVDVWLRGQALNVGSDLRDPTRLVLLAMRERAAKVEQMEIMKGFIDPEFNIKWAELSKALDAKGDVFNPTALAAEFVDKLKTAGDAKAIGAFAREYASAIGQMGSVGTGDLQLIASLLDAVKGTDVPAKGQVYGELLAAGATLMNRLGACGQVCDAAKTPMLVAARTFGGILAGARNDAEMSRVGADVAAALLGLAPTQPPFGAVGATLRDGLGEYKGAFDGMRQLSAALHKSNAAEAVAAIKALVGSANIKLSESANAALATPDISMTDLTAAIASSGLQINGVMITPTMVSSLAPTPVLLQSR